MAEHGEQPPVSDPDNVPETLCDGRFYFHAHGELATLTLTHARPRPAELFDGKIVSDEVVRARITMPLSNFVALRDLLAAVMNTEPGAATPAGSAGGTKH